MWCHLQGCDGVSDRDLQSGSSDGVDQEDDQGDQEDQSQGEQVTRDQEGEPTEIKKFNSKKKKYLSK